MPITKRLPHQQLLLINTEEYKFISSTWSCARCKNKPVHPSKIRTSCMKKWYMAESGIFGISSSVRSIWHGSGILYRQLLISLQWDLEIFWDLDIFTSMNFELTVQDPRPMPNCSYWCADSKNTTCNLVPFFHARCSNFRAVDSISMVNKLLVVQH